MYINVINNMSPTLFPYFSSEHLSHSRDYYLSPPLKHNLQVYRDFSHCCIPIRQEVPGRKMMIGLSCL